MAHDPSDRRLRGLLRTLAEHPLTDTTAYRAHLAIEGRAIPLRRHETLALALPEGVASKTERVDVGTDGSVRVQCEHAVYFYAHPLRPPTVEEVPKKPLFPPGENLFASLSRHECGPVTIVHGERGEKIEGTDHPEFAEIQRDTVHMVTGKLRYVGWAESRRFDTGRLRKGPSLVVNGVATPIEHGERPEFLADGDDLYALTPEVEQVREPEPEGLFTPGHDGKRRDTRVRSLDGSVDVVVRDSTPRDWNFIACIGDRLVLTGAHRPYHGQPSPMSAVVDLDDGMTLAYNDLVGNGRRVENGALVECVTDVGPGFYWFHKDGGRDYLLYGPLKNLSSADERTLEGWHVEGDTLFLTRYERAG